MNSFGIGELGLDLEETTRATQYKSLFCSGGVGCFACLARLRAFLSQPLTVAALPEGFPPARRLDVSGFGDSLTDHLEMRDSRSDGSVGIYRDVHELLLACIRNASLPIDTRADQDRRL